MRQRGQNPVRHGLPPEGVIVDVQDPAEKTEVIVVMIVTTERIGYAGFDCRCL